MNYQSAFTVAMNLFSDNDTSTQLFVLITDGRRQFTCDQADCDSAVKHAVYYVNGRAPSLMH